MKNALLLSLLVAAPLMRAADVPLPVIDMHLHAEAIASYGPPPVAICAPYVNWPAHDPADADGTYAMRFVKEPNCEKPLWSPTTDEALMKDTLAALERRNVYAVTSGSLASVTRWRNAAPSRILPAIVFGLPYKDRLPVAAVREMIVKKQIVVFGEVTNQYFGFAPDHPDFEPYLALLEEHDIPLAIHLGPGPPGTPLLGMREYKAALHNPMALEPVLRKHPKLRVYAMHAGWPMIDEMIAMMYVYPHLHVDVAILAYAFPPAEFYRYLDRLVTAGFGKRILYGSDQMVWPQAIEISIRRIEEAPNLTAEQKRDILYNNAARFLRLSKDEIARHHGSR
ncbi:MAG TPA: amidohydrolase family protein [Thermoanaerobaculia bacterium]|nr:amidohydrolase family protein [Thermoanaerobaculia bacterium]